MVSMRKRLEKGGRAEDVIPVWKFFSKDCGFEIKKKLLMSADDVNQIVLHYKNFGFLPT